MARVATLKEKNIKTPSLDGLEVNVNECRYNHLGLNLLAEQYFFLRRTKLFYIFMQSKSFF